MIKLISHYNYRVKVYSFTHPKKWNIYSLLKGMCKDSHYIYIYIYKVLNNLKTNKKPMANNENYSLIKYLMRSS